MAGPSNPHARVATTDLAAKGIAGQWQEVPGQLPDGAVIIAAITSCTNTSNPRNVIAAALLARNANRLGLTRKPWVKSSLGPPGFRGPVALYLEESGAQVPAREAGFRHRRVRRHDGATACPAHFDPKIQQEIIDRDLSQPPCSRVPQLRRPHPTVPKQGVLLASPPLVRRLRDCGHGLSISRKIHISAPPGWQADHAQGSVASVRRGSTPS
jgi:aconitate hydratase